MKTQFKTILSLLNLRIQLNHFLLLIPCWLFTIPYIVLVKLRRAYYKDKTFRSSAKIISVGNITAGGTGKTPFTIFLVHHLTHFFLNRPTPTTLRIAILVRGYKRTHSSSKDIIKICHNKAFIVFQNKLITEISPLEAGDEAYLLAKHCPQADIYSYSHRRTVIEQTQGLYDLYILDDGFSHLSVHPDYSIVIIDSTNPFSTGFCFPCGLLREPLSHLDRANFFVLSKTNLASPQQLHKLDLIFNKSIHAKHQPIFLQPLLPKDNDHTNISFIKDKSVIALCGIGRPAGFVDLLYQLNAKKVELHSFSDHYCFSLDDIKRLQPKINNDIPVIITAKDYVKLEYLVKQAPLLFINWYVLHIEFQMTKKDQELLLNHIYGTLFA